MLVGPDEMLVAKVAEAEVVFMHGTPSVQFTLSPASSEAMATLTGGMVGEELTVALCGRELVQAVVRERISGRGIINLPSAEAAFAAADVLNGKSDCSALEPHFAE